MTRNHNFNDEDRAKALETRRKNAAIRKREREILKAKLSEKIDDEPTAKRLQSYGLQPIVFNLMVERQIEKAINGNTKSFQLLLDLGLKPDDIWSAGR